MGNSITLIGLKTVSLIVFLQTIQIISSFPTSPTELEEDNQVNLDAFIPSELQVNPEIDYLSYPVCLSFNGDGFLGGEVASYEFPLEVQRKFQYYLSGFDFENQPVWVLEWGKWDVRGMLEGGKEKHDMYDRYFRQAIYRILNSTMLRSTEEDPVSKVVLVLDFDDYDLRQMHSIPIITYTLDNFKKFLPAFAKMQAAYCVNVNFVAQSMINLVRPIMGKEFSKVEVYGTNQAKWIPKLLKKIPRDQLPPWYGGAKDFKPYLLYG